MKRAASFALVFALSTGFALAAGDWTPPQAQGLRLYVKKHNYRSGEIVNFMLYKSSAPPDDTPANLEGSYYLIEEQMENGRWREFFTSPRNPLGTRLALDTKALFNWDQKDNERTHSARNGTWRCRFFAPRGNIAEPLKVQFNIGTGTGKGGKRGKGGKTQPQQAGRGAAQRF